MARDPGTGSYQPKPPRPRPASAPRGDHAASKPAIHDLIVAPPRPAAPAPRSERTPRPATYTVPGKHPGLVEQGNIDLARRPKVRNSDGSISTVKSISFGLDHGREVLVPSVVNVGGNWRVVGPKQALAVYQRTGQHLGVFNSIPAANRYAELLHEAQDREYVDKPSDLPTLKPATPIVTEHTHGQAHGGAAQPARGLPADYGQSNRGGLHNSDLPAAERHARERLAAHPSNALEALLGNFGHGAIGAVGGLGQLAGTEAGVDPRTGQRVQPHELSTLNAGIGKEILKSTAKDFTDPTHHKLNLALDLASVVSGGTSLVGKGVQISRATRIAEEGGKTRAALEALHAPLEPAQVLPKRLLPDETGLRKVRAEGGEVQVPNQSRNLLTAAGQHAADRLTEKIPNAPGIGAKARVARHLTEENQIRATRLTAHALPLDEAARKLRGVRGVTAREMAYTVVSDYGHTGPEGAALLDKEIALRQSQIANATGKAQARLADRVKLLQAARAHVLKPDAELKTALAEGQKLSETVTASKVARGTITADTAEGRTALHGRITHGATFEKPTPGKLGIDGRAVKNARVKVTSLQRRFQASIEANGRSSPTTTRIGGALSVWKDKLQTAEKAAAGRVKPTGVIGGKDFAPGPHAFYNPDVEKPTRGAAISARSPVSLNRAKEKIHQSEGILFRQARNRVGPETTLRSFQQEVRHLDRQARADRALGFSKPYNPDTFNPHEHVLIDPNAAKAGRELPRGTKGKVAAEKRAATAEPQQLDLDQLTPKEAVQRYIAEHTAWHQKLFPTAENVPEEHRTGLRVVDKKIADAISGADVVQRMQSGLLGKAFDFTNDLNRLGLIYANPVSYALVQGTGNALFLGLHQGIFTPTNVAKYGRVMTRLDRETRRRIDLSVGGGPARHLAHERGHAVSLQTLANFDNALADLMPRRLAWLHEAHKKGYNTPAEIHALLTDKKLEPHLNVVDDRAQQAMVKFRRNPTKARQAVGRAIFIAPWLEGSTRYLGRLALDRPITARVANEIRDRISQKQVDKFGKTGKQATGAFIPIGRAFKKAGVPVVPGMNPDSLSPIGSGIGVLKTGAELAGLEGSPLHGGTRLLGMAQPSIAAGLSAVARRDFYSGYDYPANRSVPSILREQLIGDTQHPVFPLAGTIATAFKKPTPPTGKEHYVPEAGPLDALKRAAFGSARERLVEQPYVAAQTRKIDRGTMNPVQKAQADGRDLLNTLTVGARHHGVLKPGQQLAPILRNAIKARTRRHAYYAQTGAKTQPDLFKADLGLLLKSKVITAAQAKAGMDWLATKPSKRAIEHQRDLLDPAFYAEDGMSYTQIIAAARKEIHAAQDHGH